MRSIDLLVPPESLENDTTAKLPETDSNELLDKLTCAVAQSIEASAESSKTLAESIKTALTEALSSRVEAPAENPAEKIKEE